ncbi:Ada metal-binding domain-containing protein [Curvibacter sp. RS43]|uniref:DNA-3-methyladenine glycosylase 2 family protein n=1 Tax=Curvibacter microcysteis TaxID=3026419 RepID=UPI00235F1475|nr:Ada metal-binding domain-containing protein [Curvibacter sp. RS43]MDD0809840.1 Ada metal-binding domain-containing protein [Curvibacter sp. RS43]
MSRRRLDCPPAGPQPDLRSAHPGHLSQDADACYLALQTRDARFDGQFFTGVTSTGIYCRPVCAVRAPKRENCRFFELAAQAEQAGFRPCLRCRPELAPQLGAWSHTDATRIMVAEAARWLDEPAHWPRPHGASAQARSEGPLMARLAARLGVSDRHLRRLFETTLGVSPLQYLQTQRLLCAKQLLADTDLPITEIALASGFASVRRFNAAFLTHYGLSPSALRRPRLEPARTRDATPGARPRAVEPRTPSGPATAPIRLGYRPPYDLATLGRFMAARAVMGLETVEPSVDGLRLQRTLQLQAPADGRRLTGWLRVEWQPARQQVQLSLSDALRPALPSLIRRVRQWLDLDADPAAIDAVLAPHFGPLQGLRVPGALDGFEMAVRAILGQQITVAAARTLCQRLVTQLGAPLPPEPGLPPGLSHLFPDAATLAGEGDGSALCATLGALGVVRQRQQAILALARAVHAGQLVLDGSAPLAATLAGLQALPGVGDWTAQYIAMRALRWPDAFPAGDVVLQNALATRLVPAAAPHRARPATGPGPRPSPRAAAQATEAASAPWRPWRSYAVVRIWEHGAPTALQAVADAAPTEADMTPQSL